MFDILKNLTNTNTRKDQTMKTLRLFLLASLMTVCSTSVFADKNDKLVYNNEEVNGLMISQTVYKNENSMLTNFMQYNYKYDDQNRMIENVSKKWNGAKSEWQNDMSIRYTYEGKMVTTSYYKWNKNKKEFQLIPEMTVTMDNTNM